MNMYYGVSAPMASIWMAQSWSRKIPTSIGMHCICPTCTSCLLPIAHSIVFQSAAELSRGFHFSVDKSPDTWSCKSVMLWVVTESYARESYRLLAEGQWFFSWVKVLLSHLSVGSILLKLLYWIIKLNSKKKKIIINKKSFFNMDLLEVVSSHSCIMQHEPENQTN